MDFLVRGGNQGEGVVISMVAHEKVSRGEQTRTDSVVSKPGQQSCGAQ
jgi:hypothetical protein